MKQDNKAPARRGLKRDLALTLGALGVVFGDIGTSPLYAFRMSVVAAVRPSRMPRTFTSPSWLPRMKLERRFDCECFSLDA